MKHIRNSTYLSLNLSISNYFLLYQYPQIEILVFNRVEWDLVIHLPDFPWWTKALLLLLLYQHSQIRIFVVIEREIVAYLKISYLFEVADYVVV